MVQFIRKIGHMGVAKKFEAKKEGEGDIFCQRCSCWDDQIRRENQWKYLRLKLYWPDIASCVWLDVSLICTCTLSVSFCICICFCILSIFCFCIVSVFCFCICQLLTGSQVCAARWRPSLTLLTEPPVEAASFFTPVALQTIVNTWPLWYLLTTVFQYNYFGVLTCEL